MYQLSSYSQKSWTNNSKGSTGLIGDYYFQVGSQITRYFDAMSGLQASKTTNILNKNLYFKPKVKLESQENKFKLIEQKLKELTEHPQILEILKLLGKLVKRPKVGESLQLLKESLKQDKVIDIFNILEKLVRLPEVTDVLKISEDSIEDEKLMEVVNSLKSKTEVLETLKTLEKSVKKLEVAEMMELLGETIKESEVIEILKKLEEIIKLPEVIDILKILRENIEEYELLELFDLIKNTPKVLTTEFFKKHLKAIEYICDY